MNSQRESATLPQPVDIRSAVDEALVLFASLGIEPVLIGGVALAVHGIERFTKDVDFAVTVAESALCEARIADRAPVPLTIGGVSMQTSSGVRVDLIVRRFEFQALFEEAITVARARGKLVTIGMHRIHVVPLTYLVALKMAAGRPADEGDLSRIVLRDDLNYEEARDVVYRHLGVFAARWLDRLARTHGRKGAPVDDAAGDENGG